MLVAPENGFGIAPKTFETSDLTQFWDQVRIEADLAYPLGVSNVYVVLPNEDDAKEFQRIHTTCQGFKTPSKIMVAVNPDLYITDGVVSGYGLHQMYKDLVQQHPLEIKNETQLFFQSDRARFVSAGVLSRPESGRDGEPAGDGCGDREDEGPDGDL